jgi:predicted nucleotidyltransferase component of viral defense system
LIARDYITEWRGEAPWVTDAQVEQDLVISRAVVEVFQVENLARRLAWRGGTALYRLHLLPGVRYSEDIDLVQITPEPIGEIFDSLRAVLDPWLGDPRWVLKEGRVSLLYRFSSEEMPPKPMKLKIEINSPEHFTELGHAHLHFEVRSRWWSGAATVTTFTIEELLGTKLRALYQRRKGRDLFDLWYALAAGSASAERIVSCFGRYMKESGLHVSRAQFEKNLTKKLSDPLFRADITPLLRPGTTWDLDNAAAVVMDRLVCRLPGKP